MAPNLHHQQTTGLHTLPTEILIKITTHIPGLSSLNNFLLAYPTFTPIITKFQPEIFTNVLKAWNQPLQIQKLVSAVMALRDKPPGARYPMQAFVFYYLDGNDTPLLMPHFENPRKILHYISGISDSIATYTASFAKRRISCPSIQPMHTISPTEWYRINRAFWRVYLCYELTHPGPSVTVARKNRSGKVPTRWQRRYFYHVRFNPATLTMPNWLRNRSLAPIPLVRDFLNTLTDWEIEELDAARYHVRAEVNRFQFNRVTGASAGEDFVGQPLWLQRLMGDLDHWREDLDTPADHFLVVDFHHPTIRAAHRVSTSWTDIPLSANGPNVTREPTVTLDSQFARLMVYQNYEQWGWSMWDSARASKRGILAEPPVLTRNTDTGIWERIEDSMDDVQTANQGCYEDQFDAVDRAIEVSFESDFRMKMWEAQVERVRNMSDWEVGEGIAGLVRVEE